MKSDLASGRRVIRIPDVANETPQVVERLDWGTWGELTDRWTLSGGALVKLQDAYDPAWPFFQPFGFAGGLYDPDTRLTRFGARDYSAEMRQWTARDPILFAGGDVNLYAYCGNDPVNCVDETGLTIVPVVDPRVNPTLALAAANVPDPGGENWVFAHGNRKGAWLGDTRLTPSALVNEIRRSLVPGIPTRVWACQTGLAPGYCKEIARQLNAPVYCPVGNYKYKLNLSGPGGVPGLFGEVRPAPWRLFLPPDSEGP